MRTIARKHSSTILQHDSLTAKRWRSTHTGRIIEACDIERVVGSACVLAIHSLGPPVLKRRHRQMTPHSACNQRDTYVFLKSPLTRHYNG